MNRGATGMALQAIWVSFCEGGVSEDLINEEMASVA